MSEKITKKEMSHHERDEAELARLEAQADAGDGGENDDRAKTVVVIEETEKDSGSTKPKKMFAWILTAAIIALVAIIGLAWMATRKSATTVNVETEKTGEKKEEEGGHSENEEGREVKLDSESLTSAGIETEGVTQRPAIALLRVPGAVELNPGQFFNLPGGWTLLTIAGVLQVVGKPSGPTPKACPHSAGSPNDVPVERVTWKSPPQGAYSAKSVLPSLLKSPPTAWRKSDPVRHTLAEAKPVPVERATRNVWLKCV